MDNYIYSYAIWENLNSLKDVEERDQVILFTDVESSSKLWKSDEIAMFNALREHEKRVTDTIKKYNGKIIKTIGDSYMLSFEGKDSLLNSIRFGYDIQMDLAKKPIKVKSKVIKIRLGIHKGPLYRKQTMIQGKKLMDYFGNTVNTASRMESKVSDSGHIAFSWTGKIDEAEEKRIMDWIKDNGLKVEIIDYKHRCYSGQRKRSGRLLSDLQVHTCEPLNQLKGVAAVTAFKLKVK
jgi:hypothetical protein